MDNRQNSYTEQILNKDLKRETKALTNRSRILDNVETPSNNQFRIKTSQSKKLLHDNFVNN